MFPPSLPIVLHRVIFCPVIFYSVSFCSYLPQPLFCFSNNAALRSGAHTASPAHSAVRALSPLPLSVMLDVSSCRAGLTASSFSWLHTGTLPHLPAFAVTAISPQVPAASALARTCYSDMLHYGSALQTEDWGLGLESSCFCSTSHERWRSTLGRICWCGDKGV